MKFEKFSSIESPFLCKFKAMHIPLVNWIDSGQWLITHIQAVASVTEEFKKLGTLIVVTENLSELGVSLLA